MGVNTSKEASVLEAVAKNDVRKLRDCFMSAPAPSSLLLSTVLTEHDLETARRPNGPHSDENRIHLLPRTLPDPKWVGRSLLHVAAENRDTRMLSQMISIICHAVDRESELDDAAPALPSLDAVWGVRDTSGLTPLSRAVRAGNAAAVNALVDAGANVDEAHASSEADKDVSSSWSHLRYCAANGAASMLRSLLGRGADNEEWGSDGRRPIHLAVEAGHLECVKVLLEADGVTEHVSASPVLNSSDQDGSERRRELGDEADSRGSRIDGRQNGSSTVSNSYPSRVCAKRMRSVSMYVVRECAATHSEQSGAIASAVAAAAATRTANTAGTADDTQNEVMTALQVALQDAVRGFAGSESTKGAAHRRNRDRGASLLHIACSHSRPEILSYLLSLREFVDAIEDMNDSGKSPIFMAIRHGSFECLKMLIDAGAKITATDIENWTTLHEAVKAGDNKTDILTFLINECNSNVRASDDDGWTPLHVAARFGSAKAVDILVAAGCDIDAKTESHETALLLASAQATSSEVLRKLLAHGADLSIHRDAVLSPSKLIVSRKDFGQLCILLDHVKTLDEELRRNAIDLESRSESGDTLLHLCVSEQNADATRKLLALGARLDEKNHEGVAALHLACEKGQVEIATALLEANCDPNLVRGDGMTPLHIACDSGRAKVVEALLRYGCDVNIAVSRSERYRGFSALMFAARLGDVDIISLLIEAGVDLDEAKGDGFTALHLGALNGNTMACRILVEAGANHCLADETGYYPLQLATRHSQYEVVSTLLECGVSVDGCGELGLTALHIASFICDARLIWLLLRSGAQVNLTNSDDATPLHVAAGREQGRVSMQLLLASGARVDVVDSEQDAPLHNACYKGLYQNVRLLLRRGAEPSPRNENNVTPLHLAAAAGSEETVEALLGYGADVDARDNMNRSPYKVASERNSRKAMVLLFRAMAISLQEIAPMGEYAVDPTVSTGGEDVICVICQNALVAGEETRRLPCSHTYHNTCILEWLGGEQLARHDSCPLCLKSVLPEAPTLPKSTGTRGQTP